MRFKERHILYLHIGRNKAASTSLQRQWVDHSAYLEQHGVQYALFGQPNPPDRDFPIFNDHWALRRSVEQHPDKSMLVSHEGLCCFEPELMRVMATDLAESGLRLLFYTRPYRSWIVSSYSFDVRIGFNRQPFAQYLASMQPRISAWPTIALWGDIIGWDRMRIRSIDPADLDAGEIAIDAFTAIDLVPPPSLQSSAASTRENVSAPWMLIELIRLLGAGGSGLGWSPAERAVADVLHLYLDDAVRLAGVTAPPANYLSGAQAGSLQTLYNKDLDRIATVTETRLQPDLELLAEQPFIPSPETIPREILRALRSLACTDEARRQHPGVADFASTEAFSALCR